jgi:hypothetical protein
MLGALNCGSRRSSLWCRSALPRVQRSRPGGAADLPSCAGYTSYWRKTRISGRSRQPGSLAAWAKGYSTPVPRRQRMPVRTRSAGQVLARLRRVIDQRASSGERTALHERGGRVGGRVRDWPAHEAQWAQAADPIRGQRIAAGAMRGSKHVRNFMS